MAIYLIRTLTLTLPTATTTFLRQKTTSAAAVASRPRDPTFEKLMQSYKTLLKVVSIQDLILSNPTPPLSLYFLSRLSQRLRLNPSAAAFLRRFPHIFKIIPHNSQPHVELTPEAISLAAIESNVADPAAAADRMMRLISMSGSKTLPLRAVFKVWRELGLPDDFEDSVISQNPNLFKLVDAHEPNTHLIKLVETPTCELVASVENWRVVECCKEDCTVDRSEIRFSFKHEYPPGMRLSKNFRAKVKEWQTIPYLGPYEEVGGVKKSKLGKIGTEKRAVAIVHEFLSLTVEKMVEVEKISHFRKWFGIDLNIRDLFLDHPGMFYLSTKGKRHTVFLREAYERGCLIEPHPLYEVRRKLLHLVRMERRGILNGGSKLMSAGRKSEEESGEEDSD